MTEADEKTAIEVFETTMNRLESEYKLVEAAFPELTAYDDLVQLALKHFFKHGFSMGMQYSTEMRVNLLNIVKNE